MKFERLKPSVYADGFSLYTVKFVLSFWVPLWLVRCFLLEGGVLPTEAVEGYGELVVKRRFMLKLSIHFDWLDKFLAERGVLPTEAVDGYGELVMK